MDSRAARTWEGLRRADLMVVIVAADGQIEYTNPAAAGLFGEIEGAHLSRPPASDDPKHPMAGLVEAWESLGRGVAAENPRFLRAKLRGSSVYLWLHAVPLGAGERPSCLFLGADLTPHVTGSEPVRRLVSQLAHDLRSPLTSIAAAAELLLSGRVGSLAGSQEKLVRIVDEGANRMASIIRNASSEEGAQGGAPA